MNTPSEISLSHAQLLMSQLLDGELSADDAEVLSRYLDAHPEAQDWMENLDILREERSATPPHRTSAIASIQEAVSADKSSRLGGSALLSFPNLIRPMAAAAAIALVGTVSWLGFRSDTPTRFEPNIVEFVSTDIPGASTFVVPDEETGWTVVWINSGPEKADSSKG